MMQSLYSARLGILAQQSKVDTIANNIANVNTNAYKSTNVSFKDAMYSTLQRPVESEADLNLQQGNGVLLSGITRSFAPGMPIITGADLDFRIEGDGFFTVSNPSGDQFYTRSGAFAVSDEGTEQYLVNASGDYVLDTNLNRISLPETINDFKVNSAGEIFVNEVYFSTLNVVTFANKEGLETVGNSKFAETEASGAPEASTAEIYQGSLEGSNVDLSLEMTKLIRAQRAFSLVSRALTTADEMSAVANNMR